jgi:hypothetical protein
MLERLPGADFCILSGSGPPLEKKDENYPEQLEPVQKAARAIEFLMTNKDRIKIKRFEK